MEVKIVPFNELSLHELYEILKLRAQVFVLEQECIYIDPDGQDPKALHLMAAEDGRLIGTARIFEPGSKYEEASFGRLTLTEEYRERGIAHELVSEIHSYIKHHFGNHPIRIEAQAHLRAFYSRHGYQAEGAAYILDDIEHIQMVRPGY